MGEHELEEPQAAASCQGVGLLLLVRIGHRQHLMLAVRGGVLAPVMLRHGTQQTHHVVGDPHLVGLLAHGLPLAVRLLVKLYGAQVVAAGEVVASLQIHRARQPVGVVGMQPADVRHELRHSGQLRPCTVRSEAQRLVAQHVAAKLRREILAQLPFGSQEDPARSADRTAPVVLEADNQVVEVPRLGLLRMKPDECLCCCQRMPQSRFVELLLAELNETDKASVLRHGGGVSHLSGGRVYADLFYNVKYMIANWFMREPRICYN